MQLDAHYSYTRAHTLPLRSQPSGHAAVALNCHAKRGLVCSLPNGPTTWVTGRPPPNPRCNLAALASQVVRTDTRYSVQPMAMSSGLDVP
jgi:hypothetical protein